VPGPSPNSDPDSQKRRSTRIVQAVPVTVTGVDALGRPFQERTSTLAINCHGCRYQSKHYVLKNMWVTLEIPHPETGHEERRVRGRITWIQRPRNVRELFQIGAELELPGNIWGIAFPPPDWFPYVESAVAPVPEAGAEEVFPEEWLREEVDSNIHVLPGPAALDTSVNLARQVSRLVMEARQQIQAAVREATAKAITAEIRPLLAGMQTQFNEAAERSLHATASAYAEQVVHQAVGQIAEAREAGLEELRAQWREEMQGQLEEAGRSLAAQLAEARRVQQTGFDQQVEVRLSSARDALDRMASHFAAGAATAGETAERVHKEVEQWTEAAGRRWEESLEGRLAGARAELEQLDQAAGRLRDRVTQAAAEAETGWRARLDADLAAAGARWNERIETSLAGAAQQAAERLTRHSQMQTSLFEQESAHRVVAFRQALDQATAEGQAGLARLREALAETQKASGELAESAAQAAARGRAAVVDLEQRLTALLDDAASEMNRRNEITISNAAERLQPILEQAGQQTAARLMAQIEGQLGPHLERANQAAQKLVTRREAAEAALGTHEQRLREASEQALHQAVESLRERASQSAKDFEEVLHAATARSLAEIEERATGAKHATFEELYKASEWYEKKIQTQIQTAVEKGMEQAADSLREKAGEISALFAAGLDRTSRSYVEHTQKQIEEATTEAIGASRARFAETAETTIAGFSDDMHGVAQREFERFTASVGGASDQHARSLEGQAAQLRSRVEAEAQQFVAEFQKGLTGVIQQGIEQARQGLESRLAELGQAWREQREAQARQFQAGVTQDVEQAVDAYKNRLENVSNSWLVATVTTFNEQTQSVIEKLARSAEQRLRESCAQVFANAGDALRQRLLDLATHLPDSPSPRENL